MKPFRSLEKLVKVVETWRREHTERGEEPAVLAGGVAVLQSLLDGLLGLLTLGNLLESVGGDGTLEALELQSVSAHVNTLFLLCARRRRTWWAEGGSG